MASLTQRTWVCMDPGSWWWTVRPVVLQFMGLQRVRHDWLTELNWITWTTVLSNSVKLWAMPCSVIQDGKIMVESYDKKWCTGEGNDKPLQYSCLENTINSMKKQKWGHWKINSPRLVGAQNATGEQWRNNSRKNEEAEPKQKQHPAMDVTGDGSKFWCCKEQYCIGTC